MFVLYSFDGTHFPVFTFTAYTLWKFTLISAYRKWLTCKFVLLPVSLSGGFSLGEGDGVLQPSALRNPLGTQESSRPVGKETAPPRSPAPGSFCSLGKLVLSGMSVASSIKWGW